MCTFSCHMPALEHAWKEKKSMMGFPRAGNEQGGGLGGQSACGLDLTRIEGLALVY